ncbi:hypothetical protein U7230_07050 [Carboxydochorda subterranea]|uniref:Uncharacterized protein n=1 Tax=Carboxydichorda subterranea TaxID=3109565 RepID=A0ABZ1C163_9FIRM|nr:hypothetical protein [Limnochorda sp. L945t]WRP18743.1 hypothetical protein U7230_07050 [Limnochorda sp. L945t]
MKANMLAAAHNLKTMPSAYWAKHPKAYALHVETLRQGVRFMEGRAREAEDEARGGSHRS